MAEKRQTKGPDTFYFPHSAVAFTLTSYDAAGQITQQMSGNSAASGLSEYSYSYDDAGRVTQQTENGIVTTFSYDAAGQVTGTTNPRTASGSPVKTGQAVTTYTYDSAGAGNRTAASTTGTNNTAGAGWDSLDPVSKTYTTGTDNKYTGDGEWNYSYDASGNLTGKVNVSNTDQNGVQWVYYYDNLNRLTKAERDRDGDGIGAGDASTQIDLRVVYKYDANGNRVSKSVDTDGDGYIWNAAGQYASTVDSYSSQNATNTATKATGATNSDYWTPSSLNSANEWIILNFATSVKADGIVIKEAAGTAGNGFITRIDLIESGGTAHTVFSGTDPVKLDGYLRITFPLTSYNVAKVKIFVNGQIHSTVLPAVDSVELRRHSVSTTVNASPVETKFTLDGWNPAKGYAIGLENVDVWSENIVGTSTKTHYTRGDRVDQLLGRVDANGTFWMLTDKLGSVRGLVDNGGILAAQVDYDAFGNIIGSFQNPNITTAGLGNYAWTGREWEAELNLQYNRARYYDPAMGRWISKDPLGFDAGDSNLYRYVNNAPTNAVDTSGMQETRQLSIIPIGQFAGFDGAFLKPIEWRLTEIGDKEKGGFIIQHVQGDFPPNDPRDDGEWDYWEAWRVAPGKTITQSKDQNNRWGNEAIYKLMQQEVRNADGKRPTAPLQDRMLKELAQLNINMANRVVHDNFALTGATVGSSGKVTIKGVAFFANCVSLQELEDAGFKSGGAKHAGGLLSVKSDYPEIQSFIDSLEFGSKRRVASNRAVHEVTASWNTGMSPSPSLSQRQTTLTSIYTTFTAPKK